MSFEFSSTKPVSDGTARVYKSKLNKLVPYGFTKTQDLIDKALLVIETITYKLTNNITPEDKQRTERRLYYSAIFYALHDHPTYLKRPTLYQKYFHQSDPKENANGEPWVKLADFRAKE